MNVARRQETGVQRAALRLLLLSWKNGKFYSSEDSQTMPLLRERVGLVQGKVFGIDEVSAITSEEFNT